MSRGFGIRYGDVEDDVAPGRCSAGTTAVKAIDCLAFQFGDCAVLVYDFPPESDGGAASMTVAERVAWAGSFSGRETGHGSLALRNQSAPGG